MEWEGRPPSSDHPSSDVEHNAVVNTLESAMPNGVTIDYYQDILTLTEKEIIHPKLEKLIVFSRNCRLFSLSPCA
jgi:hypothetical protein